MWAQMWKENKYTCKESAISVVICTTMHALLMNESVTWQVGPCTLRMSLLQQSPAVEGECPTLYVYTRIHMNNFIGKHLNIIDYGTVEPLSRKDTLNKGHLSNEDAICSPNYIELCTNLHTFELGTPLYTGQPAGSQCVRYREVPLYSYPHTLSSLSSLTTHSLCHALHKMNGIVYIHCYWSNPAWWLNYTWLYTYTPHSNRRGTQPTWTELYWTILAERCHTGPPSNKHYLSQLVSRATEVRKGLQL